MKRREQLLSCLIAVADEFRRDCPFATATLNCLIGAMQTDVDAGLARVALAWMADELCITSEQLTAMAPPPSPRQSMN